MERRHSLITHNDRFPNVADPHLTPAAQREACEAYVVSQRHAGWVALAAPDRMSFTGSSWRWR
jgi:hypothetical protein